MDMNHKLAKLSDQITPREGEGADLYGLILYTSSHPHLRRVLKNDEYWQALDEASGPRWAVFAARLKAEVPKSDTAPPDPTEDALLYVMVEARGDLFDQDGSTRSDMLDELGVDASDLPLLLVYTVSRRGDVYSRSWPLSDESEPKAYESLKSVLTVVSRSLERVDPEQLGHPEGVFTAVSYALQNEKDWQRVQRIARPLAKAIGIFLG